MIVDAAAPEGSRAAFRRLAFVIVGKTTTAWTAQGNTVRVDPAVSLPGRRVV